jgi:carbon monoxide dehydrogenase subunit G
MPPARRKKFRVSSRKTYAGAKKTETTGHERLASKKNLMKTQLSSEENVSTNADQLSSKDRLKISHIRMLEQIRTCCKMPNFPDNEPEKQIKRIWIERVNGTEKTWEILDPEQLGTCLPDAKDLTDEMNIGDHIAATRKALELCP